MRNSLKILVSAATAATAITVPLALVAPATVAQAQAADSGIADFYRSRGGAPLWLGPRAGSAAVQLVQILATAQVDGLNPKRYNVRGLDRAVRAARTGDPGAIQRAEAMLSAAYVAYARDLEHDPNVGVIYVDQQLRPQPRSARALLQQAATAPSLDDYVANIGWMNPIYGRLRQALASRIYTNPREAQLLALTLKRARARRSTRTRCSKSSTRCALSRGGRTRLRKLR